MLGSCCLKVREDTYTEGSVGAGEGEEEGGRDEGRQEGSSQIEEEEAKSQGQEGGKSHSHQRCHRKGRSQPSQRPKACDKDAAGPGGRNDRGGGILGVNQTLDPRDDALHSAYMYE